MLYEQTIKSETPLTFNDGLIASLARFHRDTTDEIERALENDMALTNGELGKLIAGDVDVDHTGKKYSDYHVKHLKDRLIEVTTPNITLTYPSGRNVQIANFEGLAETLQDEIQSPVGFIMKVGRYGLVRYTIDLENTEYLVPVRFSAQGNRNFVDRATAEFNKIIARHATEWGILHTVWRARIVSLITFCLVIFAIIWIFSGIEYLRSEAGKPLLGLIFPIAVFSAAVAAGYVRKKFEAVFPKISFKFGVDDRRRREKAALIWAVLTLIVAPILINLLV